jgi:hypothetical protein
MNRVNGEFVGMCCLVNEIWVEATCIYYTPPLLFPLAATLVEAIVRSCCCGYALKV